MLGRRSGCSPWTATGPGRPAPAARLPGTTLCSATMPVRWVHCRAALAEMQALGDRRGQAPIWDSLGYSHHKLGHHAKAMACFKRAVDLYSALGDRHLEGLVLVHLAEAHQAMGDMRKARAVWRQALIILTELDPAAAKRVRASLVSSAMRRSGTGSGSRPARTARRRWC